MTHSILLKHGYKVVFVGKSFTAYQLDNGMLVVWDNGEVKYYEA